MKADFKLVKEKFIHVFRLSGHDHLLHLLISDVLKCQSVIYFFKCNFYIFLLFIIFLRTIKRNNRKKLIP